MKLISMTDFVLERNRVNKESHEGYEQTAMECIDYANFLKQTLELWMFVPAKLVDGIWVVLKKPREFKDRFSTFENHQQAKEICLFDGCEITEDEGIKYLKLTDKNHISFYNFDDKFKDKTIEDYSFDYGLILTTTAIKQIGL